MENYYTVLQVAKMFNCSYNTIWRWIRDGKLKSTKLENGNTRITDTQIKDFTKNSGEK